MRQRVLRGLLVGACLLWTAGAAHAAGAIRWETSFQAAIAQAKKTDKLVMADFYTDWCGYCKKLDRETYTDGQVIQLAGQFVSVKINAEREGIEVAQRYGIRSFPSILFINGAGEVESRIGGFMPPSQFSRALTHVAKTHREFGPLLARSKANPNDAEAASRLAVIYAGRGDEARAVALLKQAEQTDPKNARGHLAKAYNGVADYYQTTRQLDRALPLFRKAAQVGRAPYDLGYAHFSIATCYLMQDRLKEAVPELKAAAGVPNVPTNMKKAAQQYLEALKQRGIQ